MRRLIYPSGVFPCYYSPIKYGDREGTAWFDVTFGEIPIKEFLHGADPRYNLMNLISRLDTEKPNRAHPIEFTRIAIPSTERDTVWYYRVTRLGRSLRSAPVVAIDSLR